MADLHVHIDLTFTRKAAGRFLALGLLMASAGELGSESVTLTTYYPAPSGVYNKMITTGDTYLARDGGGVAIGTSNTPSAGTLRMGGNNTTFRADYNNTDSYFGSFRWAGLQLGNNGDNRIIGGRTAAGGNLKFYVNNTNDAADYTVAPDGTLAMTIASTGRIGIGTAEAAGVNLTLNVNGTIRASQTGCTTASGSNTSCGPGNYATLQAGIFSQYAQIPFEVSNFVTNSGAGAPVQFLCCSCGAGGCP